jgi:hypothetical protein
MVFCYGDSLSSVIKIKLHMLSVMLYDDTLLSSFVQSWVIKSNQWTPFIFVGVEIIPFHIWGRCGGDCIVVLTSNPTHGQVYSIQHYVIKSVSDLQTVNGFSGTLISSTNTTGPHDITEILLKMAFNNITHITLNSLLQIKYIYYQSW